MTCGYRYYDERSTRDPVDLCETDALPGSDYCDRHQEFED
jgi:hypothetical protein